MITREEDDAYFLPLKRLGAPASEYRGAIVDEAWFMNPLPSAARFLERTVEALPNSALPDANINPFGHVGVGSLFTRPTDIGQLPQRVESPMLSAAEANLRYKDLGLKFTAPVRESVARMMADGKVRERAWEDVYERARVDGGLDFGNKMLGVGLDFLVQAADPLNLASAFVPVVSQVRWGQMATRMGVARARLATGAIEGAAGAAMVEPFVLLNALDQQLDYSALDSLTNIAFGAGLGGGLHWAGGYARDRIMGRWTADEIAAMAAGRGVADPAANMSQSGYNRALADLDRWESDAAREIAREALNPTTADMWARRAGYESEGRFTADYPQSVTSMYRSRFEGPEPWGYTIEQLRPETKEALVKTALAQALDDRKIDVNPLAWTDPAYKPPKPHDLAMQAEVSPVVLRWALDTAELKGTKADPTRLRAQRIANSEKPPVPKLPAALNRQQKRFAEAMDLATSSLGFQRVPGTQDLAPVTLGLTPPAGWMPTTLNGRVAAILKGEEKAPETLVDWIIGKGGLWDVGGDLAAMDIAAGKKGVRPGLINNRRDAVELDVTGRKGMSVEDMANAADAEGWLRGRTDAVNAAAGADQFDTRQAFLERLGQAVGGEPQFHPEAEYPRFREEAALAREMLADYGFDLSKMPSRDIAWLLDNPDVLGRFDEWRFVEGILDEVRSQDVQARLQKEIDAAQMDAMDEFAALWRAEASLDTFRRGLGLEDEELRPVLKNLERDYAIVEQGLAEHERNRARFADDRGGEAHAIVESADEGGAGAGRAANDGENAGARESGQGNRDEAKGPAVKFVGQLAEGAAAPNESGVAIAKTSPGRYEVWKDGQNVGHADVAERGAGDFIDNVVIVGEHQRQGIGKNLYATIERDLQRRLRPSDKQSDAAKALWKSYAEWEGRPAILETYDRAVLDVRDSGIASPSRLARTMGMPMSLAESFIKKMEAEGLVSPPDAHGNRQVLPQTEPVIEKTSQGDQIVIPGAERISAEEMNARLVAQGVVAKLTASTRQDFTMSGLFDVQGRGQADIFADAAISDVDMLVRKYGAEPERLEARLSEMIAERSDLAKMPGAGERVTKLQKQIADANAALGEIRAREDYARGQADEFARRQGAPENDANVEPRNEVVEQYANVENFTGESAVKLEASAKQLEGHIERLEAELGERVDADQKAAIGDLQRQADDFEKAGSAYLFCKAGDGE